MVGNGLYFLDTGSISLCEVAIDVAEGIKAITRKICQLRERQFTECNEVLDFDSDAIANECVF